MRTDSKDYRHIILAEQEQHMEMILDLTRRIHLLENLMSAAHQKRWSDTHEVSLTAVQMTWLDELNFQ